MVWCRTGDPSPGRAGAPQPVHESVDGWWTVPVTRGKTGGARWIACGRPKNLQLAASRALCAWSEGSRTAFTTEHGPLGGNPGRGQEPGDRHLLQAPVIGGGPGRTRKPGAGLPAPQAGRCGRVTRGPSISYMEGPRRILPDIDSLPGCDTPEPGGTTSPGAGQIGALASLWTAPVSMALRWTAPDGPLLAALAQGGRMSYAPLAQEAGWTEGPGRPPGGGPA